MNIFKKHKDYADTFNSYVNLIKNTSFVLSAILLIWNKLAEKLKGIKGFSDFLDNNSNLIAKALNFLTNINSWIIGIFIVSLGIIIYKFIWNCIKSQSASFQAQRDLSFFIHTQFVHDVRCKIVELENISQYLEKYKHDPKKIEDNFKKEWDVLKNNVGNYVNVLSEYLSAYRNDTISVCVKTFAKRLRHRTEFMNERIITIARSSNTRKERQTSDNTIVKNNTDFYNLCNGQSVFFGCSNLSEKETAGQYSNDSTNWTKKCYDSTLVAPIRYNTKDSQNSNNNIKPDILGFLCIDSTHIIEEWESQDSFELQTLAIFADILYIYIKEFYECYERIGYIK